MTESARNERTTEVPLEKSAEPVGSNVSSFSALTSPSAGVMTALSGLLLGVVYARSHNPDAFNHDVGQLLYFAERMLAGERLYVDLIEENLPLIFWISSPAVALAQWIGAAPILVFNLATAIVSFAAAALCHRVLRYGWPESPAGYSLALVGLLLCLELLTPGSDFGQRDNLLVIAVMPYLFAAAARASNRPLSPLLAVAVGALAGIGMSLKPHFGILWVIIEARLWFAGHRLWRRPETAAIVSVVACYLGLFYVLYGEPYAAVMRQFLSLAPAYFESDAATLLFPTTIVLIVAAVGVAAIVKPTPFDREVRGILLAAMFAFATTALTQGKGWTYHYYPATATALLLLGVIVLGLVAHPQHLRQVLKPSATLIPLLVLVGLTLWAGRAVTQASYHAFGPGRTKPSMTKVLMEVVAEHAWHRPIYVMSTSVIPAFPLVNLTGATWASRYCCLWHVSGSYTLEEKRTKPFPYHELEEMTELERIGLDNVIEDFRIYRPDLLIVDTNPHKQAFGRSDFQFLQYYRRDPRFEEILRKYRHVADVGAYRVFERGF